MNGKLLVAIFLLTGFVQLSVIAQPTQVPIQKQPGYFFSGNDGMLDDGVNCFVVQNLKEFEKFFGKNRSDTPHFSKEWMLILVMPSTTKDINLDFSRVSMKAGTFIEVYCDLNQLRGKRLTYEINPLAVCTIPRYEKVQTVNFYEERKHGLELIEKVDIKQRR